MRRPLLALSTVVSASVLATSIFTSSASAGVVVGFVLGPTGDSPDASDAEAQAVYDDSNDRVLSDSGPNLDTSGVAFVTDVTADQITGDNAVYGLVFVQDDSPFDNIELAIGRIEVNVSENSSSPLIDFMLSGFVDVDYSSSFTDGVTVGPDGVLFTSDDVAVTGDRNNPFHYGSLLAFRITLSEAQSDGVTEPFEIDFLASARNQANAPVMGDRALLTVTPMPVPEPGTISSLVIFGAASLLRRKH